MTETRVRGCGGGRGKRWRRFESVAHASLGQSALIERVKQFLVRFQVVQERQRGRETVLRMEAIGMRIIDWNDTPDAVGNRGFEIADGGGRLLAPMGSLGSEWNPISWALKSGWWGGGW